MSNADGLVDLDAIERERTNFCLQCGPEGLCRGCQELEMNYTKELKAEVESLRARVRELEGKYIKKSSILEELCDLRDYLITLEASRRDNDTRAAVRRLRLSISNIAHKNQLAETEAG